MGRVLDSKIYGSIYAVSRYLQLKFAVRFAPQVRCVQLFAAFYKVHFYIQTTTGMCIVHSCLIIIFVEVTQLIFKFVNLQKYSFPRHNKSKVQ